MADISKLNLGTGADLDLKDAYVRSLIPSNASASNKLATMADVGGGTWTRVLENVATNYDISSIIDTYSEIFIVRKDGANTPMISQLIATSMLKALANGYYNMLIGANTGSGTSIVSIQVNNGAYKLGATSSNKLDVYAK